jgi:hypothetical protein
MDWSEFGISILETLVGGILLTFLFFLGKEKLFPLPPITGRWFFELKTVETAYNPYNDMVLRYVCFLWLEGNRIEGTVEKIYEKSSTGERPFVGDNRTRGVVTGYVKKSYLGKDRIFLHVVEDGHGRESTNFYDLIYKKSEETMQGTFFSMVADQRGTTTWTKEGF